MNNFEKELIIPPCTHKTPSLHFYARFESGNLHRVVRKFKKQVDTTFSGLTAEQLKQNGLKVEIKPTNSSHFMYEYDIYLDWDTSSIEGLMHWYYFKTISKNIEPGTKIRFNIRNLHRTKSLYENGMLPRIYYQNQE